MDTCKGNKGGVEKKNCGVSLDRGKNNFYNGDGG